MDADWDNLLILDSCRYDLFSEVAVEDGLKGELTTFRSRGSSSSEFLKENFAGRTYDDKSMSLRIPTRNVYSIRRSTILIGSGSMVGTTRRVSSSQRHSPSERWPLMIPTPISV